MKCRLPFSTLTKAGVEQLRRLNMTTEIKGHLNLGAWQPFSGLIASAHVPHIFPDGSRVNIATPDEAFRQYSLKHTITYIQAVSQFPNIKKITMHTAPKRWITKHQKAGQGGDYELMIDGIRQIADEVAEHNLLLVIENNNTYWDGIPDAVSATDADLSAANCHFGSAPDEWLRIYEDVASPDVYLCLDPSHACTYCQTLPTDEERVDAMMAFLAKPGYINHVHWNDNYLFDPRGRQDSHLCIGQGTIPREFHAEIKKLDATFFLEHFYSIEALEEELQYIDNLD